MLKTLQLNNRVIGMYLADNGNVYFNGDKNAKTTFITSEFSNYVPILEMLNIDHRKEVVFANGVNKNEEVVTYNKAISGRSFNDAVIRQGKIDVTANDLFVGPITLFLNFTSHNLTVVTNKEFRKTFAPIENDHLDDFKGKIVVLNLHTLNTPKSIQNITGITNYLETLQDKFKNRDAPNIDEMREVVKYASDKWGETKFFTAMAQSNSMKVATMVELSEAEFIKDKADSLYLMHQDLVITLENIVEAVEHPATSNAILTNRDLQREIRHNSFTCYIVDSEDKIGDRYINIAGSVKRINKVKDHNRANGLYIISTDLEGKVRNELACKLEELDGNKYVYKSIEEANIGADMRVQYRDNIETTRTELEVTKLERANENIERSSDLEQMRAEIKLVTDLVKSQGEVLSLAEKRKLERFKTDDEVRGIYAKRDFESFRYDVDRRERSAKLNYEDKKYERDSFVEGLKTVGALAGVAATGFLLYGKFAGAK